MSAPVCTNCGDPLGLSVLYCDRCCQRGDERWYEWRERLARVRLCVASIRRTRERQAKA